MIQNFKQAVNLIRLLCWKVNVYRNHSVNFPSVNCSIFTPRLRICDLLSFVILLCLSAVIISCKTEKGADISKSWDPVIENLEVVMISHESDSMKALQIGEIFNKYNTTFEEYREFYESILQQSVSQNIDFLKKVEKMISETLSARAREEQKLYNRQIITPQNQDSSRLKKPLRE